MQHPIYHVEKQDYLQLIEIWEKSVRATHDFLPDKEIHELRPLILTHYFDALLLKCCKNLAGEIIGFIGIADKKIEMLFISPDAQGNGVGSALCQYAVEHLRTNTVDVNEQNPRAREFYEKMGFNVVNRSESDGQGKPYPILHMKMKYPFDIAG